MTIWDYLPKNVVKGYLNAAMYAKSLLWYSTHWKDPEYHSIPIIINNYNRLTFLIQLIDSLEKRGYSNIYIIDNDSTYPPLLDYYSRCPYKVFYLKKNLGYTAIWRSEVYDIFKHSFYVYTDSDIVLHENCPEDFMKVFLKALKKYPRCMKVGFGLAIDDLPECYRDKDKVVHHESQFWGKPIDSLFFEAQIDTTFALYRPFCYGHSDGRHLMLRSGKPYIARHAPWYVDSNHLSEEEKYYISSCSFATHWSEQAKNHL